MNRSADVVTPTEESALQIHLQTDKQKSELPRLQVQFREFTSEPNWGVRTENIARAHSHDLHLHLATFCLRSTASDKAQLEQCQPSITSF